MKHGSQLRVGSVLAQLEELLTKAPEKIKDVVARYPTRHGVYAISDPEDFKIVYVGMSKTGKKGVGQRLWDHLNNKGAAVLKSMVGGDKKKAGEYLVRVIEEDDFITRRNLEALAIGALSPEHNK